MAEFCENKDELERSIGDLSRAEIYMLHLTVRELYENASEGRNFGDSAQYKILRRTCAKPAQGSESNYHIDWRAVRKRKSSLANALEETIYFAVSRALFAGAVTACAWGWNKIWDLKN